VRPDTIRQLATDTPAYDAGRVVVAGIVFGAFPQWRRTSAP
jgi:hypothetical protein